MSKYVPPNLRKTDSPDLESDKRRQRLLRFGQEKKAETHGNRSKNHQNNAKFENKPAKPTQIKPPHYGFVSRGEESTLQSNEEAQKEYFEWILQHFEKEHKKLRKELKEGPDLANDRNTPTPIDLTLTHLRKLREAMLHQKPLHFSKKIHLFSVRISAPVGHYQTYVPSINHLLELPELLSDLELREVAILLVLHISHHNRENEKSFRVFDKYLKRSENESIYQVLVAWATGDFYNWLRLYSQESDHCVHAVMSGGKGEMLSKLAEAMTRLFFTISTREFEKFLPERENALGFMEKYAPLWREENASIIVRARK